MSRQLLRPWGLLTLALAGLCALLALVMIAQWLLAGGSPEGDAVRVTAANPGELTSLETRRFELPAESEYAVISARPLFHEDRRPEQRDEEQQDGEGQVAEEQAPNEPPPVTLTGVIITPEKRIAMLRNTKSKEYVTLKEGDPLEGWVLKEVERRRIVFNAGDERQIVELDVYTGPAGGRAPGNGQNGSPGGQQTNQPDNAQQREVPSAAEQIRARIERERERRRQLIEEARKRQDNSDN